MVHGFYKIKPDHECGAVCSGPDPINSMEWFPGSAAIGYTDPDQPPIVAEPCEGRYAGPEYPGGGPVARS